ncbi:MAG TPA: M15 family metallopeptidase [Candidatus Saccharimonadales bacterium]|nr:M15 family metallopeptidase [Candidatus Saccharimonadales bacterium]
MPKKLFFLIIPLIILGGSYLLFFNQGTDDQPPAVSKKPGSKNISLNDDEAGKYTIDNQNSIYFIINKKRSLPSTFIPRNLVTTASGVQLRSDTANALQGLQNAAKSNGIYLKLISGYRSYDYQAGIYNDYVKKDGQARADTYSARPGHSEHQTGLAADVGSGICDLVACFGDTKAGKWLADNAHKYGFIIRYPKAQEHLTGYLYEPWHIRYIGKDLAAKVHKSGQTLEQFFGLPAAADY